LPLPFLGRHGNRLDGLENLIDRGGQNIDSLSVIFALKIIGNNHQINSAVRSGMTGRIRAEKEYFLRRYFFKLQGFMKVFYNG